MDKFLVKVSVFLVAFFVINSGFALYVAGGLTENRRSKYHWACSLAGNQFDLAFIGSSRVEMTVDPRVIDDIVHTNSINIGASGAGAGDQYLLATKLLRGNKVDTVYYQIDYLTLANKFSYPFKDYIWLCYDDQREVQSTVVDHCGAARYWAWSGIPFLRLMEFSSQYDLFPHRNAGTYWNDRKGGQQRDTPDAASLADQFAVYIPDSLSVKYVLKTIELCKHNDVELVLFQAPLRAQLSLVSDFPACTTWIDELVESRGLAYWDFSDIYRTRGDLFYDNHHLNSAGVLEFSSELAKRIAAKRAASDAERLTNE
ncbi:hypothetical protein EC9_30850 [Rosistilla ulvae]|uniref:SGNH/GDSL hydrolase family protein n=2 Tax=Rosistilla ulvae TaxID=1930277 RepID=A0A517M1Z6_9BACT|nr:hypothetical protein EC9_30850 [Rosistilla ulvae]